MNSTSTCPRLPLLVGAALISCTLPLSAQIWSEEFDAGTAPDPAVWSYDLGSWGWGNQELQNYTSASANVRVAGGHLVITARQEPGGAFTSGRIRTQDKFMFQYGTVEARIKIPDLGDGLWPAFWTLGNSFSSVGWPYCGEIDVLEMGSGAAILGGVVNRRVYSTAHWHSGGGYAGYGQHLVTAADLDDDFHVWRMEWTPTAITTYIDGQQIWVMSIANPQSFGGEEFHAPHFFILNLAVGGTFTGIFAPGGVTASLPAEYRIDYVRVYDNGHTILGGSSLGTASSSAFGTGCPSSSPLTLAGDLPIVGSTWLLTATQIDSSSPACLFWFGLQAIPGGISLDSLGGLGCFAYTNANLGFVVSPVVGPNNYSVHGLTLPPAAALMGYQLTVQATAASSTVPLGIATSNGVTGVIGI